MRFRLSIGTRREAVEEELVVVGVDAIGAFVIIVDSGLQGGATAAKREERGGGEPRS